MSWLIYLLGPKGKFVNFELVLFEFNSSFYFLSLITVSFYFLVILISYLGPIIFDQETFLIILLVIRSD